MARRKGSDGGEAEGPHGGVQGPGRPGRPRGERTVNEPAGRCGVHPTLVHAWKKQVLAGAGTDFANGTKTASTGAEAREAELYEQIGRLKMEREWTKN
jgi:putative transposase